MHLQKIVKINAYIAILYLISILLNINTGISIPQNLLGLTVFFLFGVNITSFLSCILNRKFNIWEMLSISFLASILIYPALLNIEYIIIGKTFDWLPLLNFLIISGVLFGWLIWQKKENWIFLKTKQSSVDFKNIINSPITWTFLIGIAIIISVFSAFKFLPDKDPFTWLFYFQENYSKNSLGKLSYRPLFSSFVFSITKLSDLNIFVFLKYIMPFFYLLVIFPAFLIAKTFKKKGQKFLFLLSIFTSANLILYAQTPMPQSSFIWLCFYFVFFLLYSYIQKDSFWFYLAGLTSFFAIFYHEAAVIIFGAWIIGLLWKKRLIIRKYKYYSILILLLTLSNLNLAGNHIEFFWKWAKKVVKSILNPDPNWLYPLSYKNIDGNQMGWGSIDGVAKFYSYYAGFFFFILIASLLWYLIQKRKQCRALSSAFIKNEVFLILGIIFLIFFSIAEIFPRFPGIALLPDRSWVFVTIFLIPLLFLLLKTKPRKWLLYFLIVALFINIFGSLYINNQKKYSITKTEIKSAIWIKNSLPENKIIINSGERNLLIFYAETETLNIASELFYEKSLSKLFTDISNKKEKSQYLNYNPNFYKYIKSLEDLIKESSEKYKKTEDDSEKFIVTEKHIRNNIKLSNKFLKVLQRNRKKEAPANFENIYIYYSLGSKKDPYYNRPYNERRKLEEKFDLEDIVLNKYPEKFEKIYEDKESGIIIWKVL